MYKYDVSALFFTKGSSDRFVDKLEVPGEIRKQITEWRNLGRSAIRDGFVSAKNSSEILARLSSEQKIVFHAIEPRFWPQGSTRYRTLNMPAHNPPQQIDSDDGVYLPIEGMRDAPLISKEIFFEIVDVSLRALARIQGWEFEEKDTCARLVVSDLVHLDYPLYAIPKERFTTLQKAENRAQYQDHRFVESVRYLKEDEIYLARRDSPHWIKSDPMEIQDWYEESVKIHGAILRRVCRYIKAWRDWQWAKGGPSSIALMICVVTVFDENSELFDGDGDAIISVLKQLPELLRKKVRNPRDTSDVVFPRNHSGNEINAIISTASTTVDILINAVRKGESKAEVIRAFQAHFGKRIPEDIQLVRQNNQMAASLRTRTPISVSGSRKQRANMITG